MSHLLSRLLLAFVLVASLPLIYVMTLFIADRWMRQDARILVVAGAVTAGVLIVGWILAWRRQVHWNRRRRALTVASVAWSLFGAILLGILLHSLSARRLEEESVILSTMFWGVLWLGSTALIWRETTAERAERLRSIARGTVSCLNCGYNLTGLHEARCPECGTQYTLDELLASANEGADELSG